MQTTEEELTVTSLIFQASMRQEMRGDDSLSKQLVESMKAISPTLDAEFQQEGTQHPLAHKTLSEIREIAAAGNLPTEGSEIRINRRDAAMDEWNRRVHAGELTKEDFQRFDKVSSLEALVELGWKNPYGNAKS